MAQEVQQVDGEKGVEYAIEAENLTKAFGNFVAVDHISFKVNRNEIFGFLGPNGAGKSTTINMLTTLLKPTEGTARVNGFDVVKEPAKVRQSIGVVPQEYTADEDLTGWENVLMVGDLYGLPRSFTRQRAKELLDMVELTAAANKKVENYSGGMRRRLEIAMGLINQPSVLFLDEPTLGLDVQTRAAIWHYISRLRQEYGMTIMVTTHYLEEADAYCDRIAIIDHGKILKIGSPRELKEGLGGDVVSLTVSGSVEAAKQAIAQVLSVDVDDVDQATLRFKVRDASTAVPRLFEAFNASGIKISKLSITEPTMDEVYMEYTGKSLRDEEVSSEEAFRQRVTIRRARKRWPSASRSITVLFTAYGP
ncbi:MAG: ATP-binding cassette domain-containing protein [Thermoprotei archaeon]